MTLPTLSHRTRKSFVELRREKGSYSIGPDEEALCACCLSFRSVFTLATEPPKQRAGDLDRVWTCESASYQVVFLAQPLRYETHRCAPPRWIHEFLWRRWAESEQRKPEDSMFRRSTSERHKRHWLGKRRWSVFSTRPSTIGTEDWMEAMVEWFVLRVAAIHCQPIPNDRHILSPKTNRSP